MEQFAGPSTEAVAPQIRERSSIWEGLRDQITQLHSVQGKPLIEVMSIIEREHGFVASQRQYKIKISEWRVGKNIKVDEYKFMVQTQANRAQENKDTHFRVRGRDVAPEKIERAVKRQKLSDQELIAMPSIRTYLLVRLYVYFKTNSWDKPRHRI
ncbi:hypothetical protein N431DRAFT_355172 [Stipitochalara longipes BDJ]|nr:hypothetical protein N431DRAFT_355172 [Stipitochalara longipes BDJ]